MIQTLKHRKWEKIIQRSGLFDAEYYLFTYTDVRKADIDPIKHYIKHGAKEGRNPNSEFETSFYLANYVDVKESGINPFIHYILYGQKEQRTINNKLSPLPPLQYKNNNIIKNIDKKYISKNINFQNDEIIVSVICRTYNHEQFIKRTLEGILNQVTNFDFEIIIGDDASKDQTTEIIETYQRKYPGKIVLMKNKTNIGSVMNLANITKKIKGKYVAVCDGDDYWIDPYKLTKQVDFLEQNKDYNICFHSIAFSQKNNPNIELSKSVEDTTTFNELVQDNYIYMSSVMYKWIYPNGLDEQNFNFDSLPADWQLHLQHANFGKIKFLDDVMAVYNIHDNGMWGHAQNGMKIHLKYGLKKIKLFKYLENFKDGLYIESLRSKQLYLYRILINHYLKEENYQELYDLAIFDSSFVFKVFRDLGYLTENIDLADKTTLIDSLRNQTIIDIVVTSYNHEVYIKKCLDSVLIQTGLFKMNIIVGDDCSTDQTLMIIKQYKNKFPELFTIMNYKENQGLRNNMKSCFSICTGNFIAICEGDDYWIDEKKLHKQMLYMRENKDCSMCFNWLKLYREEKAKFEPHPAQEALTRKKINFYELSKTPIIGNFSACMYTHNAVKKVPDKYYNDPLGFDWLFNMYIAREGNVGFIKEQMSVYRIHSKGQWSSNTQEDIQQKIRRSQENFKKHFEMTK